MVENFADYPKSIGEIVSEREANGSKWTPRDVLIDVLRDIDAGKIKPDILVLAMRLRHEDPEEIEFGFRNASPDFYATLGLVTRLAFKLQDEN